jgi:endonuclease III
VRAEPRYFYTKYCATVLPESALLRDGHAPFMPEVGPIEQRLIDQGRQRLDMPLVLPAFAELPEADKVVNDLEHRPHAFVMACLMDRQWDSKLVWRIPWELSRRIDSHGGDPLSMDVLGRLSEDEWVRHLQSPKPSLHRFPKRMGRVLYCGIQRIIAEYGGDAGRIWADTPSSKTVIHRFREFYGAGPKIACMAVNILFRDFKIPLSDYRYIDISADSHVRRVMARLGLVEEGADPDEVIRAAREIYPDFPGVFDPIVWEIGHDHCHPDAPDCRPCSFNNLCPSRASFS